MTEKKMKEVLWNKLTEAFEPVELLITDESSKHANHNPDARKGETHFRIKIVSKKFQGITKIEQHRLIYAVLGDEIKDQIHALALTTQIPEE